MTFHATSIVLKWFGGSNSWFTELVMRHQVLPWLLLKCLRTIPFTSVQNSQQNRQNNPSKNAKSQLRLDISDFLTTLIHSTFWSFLKPYLVQKCPKPTQIVQNNLFKIQNLEMSIILNVTILVTLRTDPVVGRWFAAHRAVAWLASTVLWVTVVAAGVVVRYLRPF